MTPAPYLRAILDKRGISGQLASLVNEDRSDTISGRPTLVDVSNRNKFVIGGEYQA
jgi:hypothetical protein